jgi:hypothetical protein
VGLAGVLVGAEGAGHEPSPAELACVGGAVGEVRRNLLPPKLQLLLQVPQNEVVVGVPRARRLAPVLSLVRLAFLVVVLLVMARLVQQRVNRIHRGGHARFVLVESCVWQRRRYLYCLAVP